MPGTKLTPVSYTHLDVYKRQALYVTHQPISPATIAHATTALAYLLLT